MAGLPPGQTGLPTSLTQGVELDVCSLSRRVSTLCLVSTVCRGPSHVTLLDSQHFQREALAATVSPVEVQNFE